MKAAYELAKAEIGTWEWKGNEHNPRVLAYYDDVGHGWVGDDETPWCAAFVGAMLKRAGLPHTNSLRARSYEDWGVEVPLEEAQEGDLVVFWRNSPTSWQGHVGFYVGMVGDDIVVLGGNQSDQVREARYSKDRLLSVRRIKKRKKLESRTVRGTLGAIAGGLGTATTAIAQLDETAQLLVIIFAFIIVGAAFYALQARLDDWAKGWK